MIWLFKSLGRRKVMNETHMPGQDTTPQRRKGMSMIRIALANIRVPATPEESVLLATSAVAEAGRQGALVICFPECFYLSWFERQENFRPSALWKR